MEQAASKSSNRGLRERVQARRGRAEKISAARAMLEREVAGIRSGPVMPPPAPPRFAVPNERSFGQRLLRLFGHRPAGTPGCSGYGSAPLPRGTPTRAAPPPVGIHAYNPTPMDAQLPPSVYARRRHNRKSAPLPMPGFMPKITEFLLALLVVGGLGFFILSAARGILDLPALKFTAMFEKAAVQRASDRAAAQRAAASVEATAAAQAALPDQPVTILLMGSDQRANDTGFRTDVMLLLTVDAQNRRVSALSFPRDLVGQIPGYGDGRINTIMGQGGFESVQGTFEASYGVRPQYYFMINFESFVGLINSIGGIEINAAQELEDSCDLYWSTAGTCRVEPGKREMDGDTALWYVRSRKSSSDFDRLRRAQEVMEGVFARFMSMQAMSRLPELYVQYSQDVETNMGLTQIVGLLPTAAKIAQDRSLLTRYSIPIEITADWFMPDGSRVLLPDYDAVRQIVKQATFQE